jgi:hypothetical protein
MSKVQRADAPESRSRFAIRFVAVGAAALLLSSAFQASFAGSRSIAQANYPNNGGGGGGGGLSSGETAGVVVGGVIVVGGALYASGVIGHHGAKGSGKGKGGHKDKEKSPNMSFDAPALPDSVREFSGVRLAPGAAEVMAGDTQVVDLQVRGKQDGTWYTVTDRPETTIRLVQNGSALLPMNGTKNAFCVPLTVSQGADGKSVTVVGTFAPAGQEPLSAEAQLRVRVAKSDLPVRTSRAQ